MYVIDKSVKKYLLNLDYFCKGFQKFIFNKKVYFKDKKLKGLKRVKLESAVTHFWRYVQSYNLFKTCLDI